ncbi:MAG TPA: hypothetical protein VNA15_03400 [Candidatus Angelobacter sp.]|nr:hypothetical protein [Candidatus Angelobacter sp.]
MQKRTKFPYYTEATIIENASTFLEFHQHSVKINIFREAEPPMVMSDGAGENEHQASMK